MKYLGKYPGFIREYQQTPRRVRVEIPGITDGAEVLPLAELCYAMGDKSEHTEIRILAGDRVWIEFEAGDPRYPIIVGYRPRNDQPNADSNDWRRWHHENIETEAFTDQLHIAGHDHTTQTGNDHNTQASNDANRSAGNNIADEAQNQATYTVGASSVTITNDSIVISSNGSTLVLDASGITLNGAAIHLNG